MGQRPKFDWFINAWLDATGTSQAELRKRAGWSKRKASDICAGGRYNRDIVNDAAVALNCEPFELLLHPEEANELRQIRGQIRLAAERRTAYVAPPSEEKKDGTTGG